jgi:tetratricopeptide (TPR) repeat protein
MRAILAALAVVVLAAPLAADESKLKEARERWLRGNYEEARDAYQALVQDPKHGSAAVIGLSRAWQSRGEYDKALAVVEQALAADAKPADLLARRAELLQLRGRWDEALRSAEQAIELRKDQFLARWVRAQIYRDRGELKQADSEFRWFVRTYTARSDNDDDIKNPEELLLVGLAGAENARWHALSDQFSVILNDVYGDALRYEPAFWLAEYEAGMLLLEKYNYGEARDAFEKALKLNPQAAEVYVGRGTMALQKYEIKDAERDADRALEINPNLPAGLQLKADLHLAAGDLPTALKALEKARTINPRDERTLGRLAACALLQRKPAEFDRLVKEVESFDAKPGIFYLTLAEALDERRRFDLSEKFFLKAGELHPMLPWAANGLGMLYMRMGREKEAKAVLTKAFESDAFNVRVANTLKVLRHLDRYETLTTKHFTIRYDPKKDKALAQYMALYLEEIHAELAEAFQYRPPGPILVEVFNNHEMFSGRVVALPDLHTIGACTGRMFAMVSPHGDGIAQPFNWARVLRHELVHIFNLEQTNFQCPHWLTEGLAVINEGFARPQPWNELLARRVPAGELMNLDNIQLGFIRPRSPEEWHLAYCQSQLYVEYLKEKYGPQTVRGLLNAYRDGLDNAAAIQKVCRVDKATFEKGYRDYLNKVVAGLRARPAEKEMTFTQLREAHDQDPGNLDLAARLAEQYQLRRRNSEARKLVDAVLAKRKNHPLASLVKARLLLAAGDDVEAAKLLQAAVDPKSPDPRLLFELGRLQFEASDFAAAARTFELGRQLEPQNSRWLLQLARVHGQAGDKDRQIAVLKELAPLDAEDLEVRQRLARLLLDAGRHAEAERYARQALEIDIRNAEARDVLFRSLAGQKKDAEADRLRKILE